MNIHNKLATTGDPPELCLERAAPFCSSVTKVNDKQQYLEDEGVL
jgi:hypothetical protein